MSNTLEFDSISWNALCITDVCDMRVFLNSLEFLKGGKIQEFWTMGLIFESERGYVELDEPVVLIIEGIQFEILCLADNVFKVGVNTLTMKEKSYQNAKWSREAEELFDNVVGHTVISAEVRTVKEKDEDHIWGEGLPDQDEYIKSVDLILDSGKKLCFTGWYDYMVVSICEDLEEHCQKIMIRS